MTTHTFHHVDMYRPAAVEFWVVYGISLMQPVAAAFTTFLTLYNENAKIKPDYIKNRAKHS